MAFELYHMLLCPTFQDKLEIKKDKKGMVFVQGAVVKEASNAKELNALFEEGSKNRHTASTSKFCIEIMVELHMKYSLRRLILYIYLYLIRMTQSVREVILE